MQSMEIEMKNQPTPPRKSNLDDMKPVNRAAKRALATKKG